jgi:hypothetical protein
VNDYQVSCLGKTAFPSRSAARRRARQIRGEGGPDMHAYRCRYCGHTHLGHRPGHATYLHNTPTGPIPLQEYAR